MYSKSIDQKSDVEGNLRVHFSLFINNSKLPKIRVKTVKFTLNETHWIDFSDLVITLKVILLQTLNFRHILIIHFTYLTKVSKQVDIF